MQTQYTLIMLPNNPIIISNEKLSIKDECYHLEGFTTIEDDLDKEIVYKNGGRKIIAGFNHLPQINFSKLTKEEKERIGWVDVEELCDCTGKDFRYEWIRGFKAHQSITNKMFSLDDVENCWNEFVKIDDNIINNGSSSSFLVYLKQFLQQPIQLNVEI